MQSKLSIIEQLQPKCKSEIAKNLTIKEVINYAITSTINLEFFKPMADVRKLLHHVVCGEHNAVKVMLNKDLSLFYRKGQVTDCSGRTFENISGFEYALWALDKNMWTTMLDCLPVNQESNKALTLKFLNGQYEKIKTEGVTYTLHGKTITERHFDFGNTIIKELYKQVDFQFGSYPNWPRIQKHWKKNVGQAQKLFPMHVVYEYCSDEYSYSDSFDYSTNFSRQPRHLSRQFYNCTTKTTEDWFAQDSKMGIDFAIVKSGKGCRSATFQRLSHATLGGCDNLMAMRNLFAERIKDFINLEERLERLITIDFQSCNVEYMG